MKFTKGRRVRYVAKAATNTDMILGNVYTICEEHKVGCYVKDDKGDKMYMYRRELELLDEDEEEEVTNIDDYEVY